MAQTSNLLITEIAANQNQKEVTANNAFVELEGALTNLIVIAMPDADYTLNTTEGGEALGNMAFEFTGTLTGAHNIIVPINKKLYAVQNNTTGGFTLTVKTLSGTGVLVAVDATTYTLVYCDGTNVVAVGSAGGGVSFLSALLDVLITSPTDGQALIYNSGSGKWENGNAGGGSAGLTPGPTAGFRGFSATGAGTPADNAIGMSTAGNFGSTVQNAGDTPQGQTVQIQMSTSSDAAGVGDLTGNPIRPAWFDVLQFQCRMDSLTDIRMWGGISSSFNTSLLTADPGASGLGGAAFRYQSGLDTNFQCCLFDTTATTVVDSGVAADTNPHQFIIKQSPANTYKFYIDGNLVATISTNAPGALNLHYVVQIDSAGSATVTSSIYVAYMYWWSAL